MDRSVFLWPSEDMDFWKIKNDDNVVNIKWSRNYFEDYKRLAYEYYECGYRTYVEIISDVHNNFKTDVWFFPCIFLIRHSIELGLKALLCRECNNKNTQEAYKECRHDVLKLFEKYCDYVSDSCLTPKEVLWLRAYLNSLVDVDEKSDEFRFTFEDEFFYNYKNQFLDIAEVMNNLFQAFSLVKKCLQEGSISRNEKFDGNRPPDFFVFALPSVGNCFLFQRLFDDEFHIKETGYTAVIDFLYHCNEIPKEIKFYPLMFMFRNAIELCLKRLFYIRFSDGISLNDFRSKRKSHSIKKDLWRIAKPVIMKCAMKTGNDTEIIEIVERLLDGLHSIDKNGDIFRYPTSYSMEYRFDNKQVDLKNVYEINKSIINFLDCCGYLMFSAAEYEAENKCD